VPTRCVSGNITGTVIYHDIKNNRKMVEVQPVTVGSVCPFLEKVPMDLDGFKTKVKALPSNKTRMQLTVDPQEVFDKLQGKCSAMHKVGETYSPDGNTYLVAFSARGAYSKNFIGTKFSYDVNTYELAITVYGEQEEMITGLSSEIVDIVIETGGSKL